MGILNKLAFVSDEIKDIPDIGKKPSGGILSFISRVRYAFSLAFKEKEIFFFAALQWAAIGLGYLLWVQVIDIIPLEVWQSPANSEGASVYDWILLVWSFICVGIVAFPVGLLTGCMGATHFLHKQGRESTVATCFKLVMPQSWPLWAFHWIDGWVTVNRMLERIPSKNDRRTPARRAQDAARYYAWKLGVSGVLPCIVTGNGLIQSGKNSVVFIKDNFVEVAKLRAGYSALCWIVGIVGVIGCFVFFSVSDVVPRGGEKYEHIYAFYLWAGVPILIPTGIVVLILRPIYVLAMCDLYSDYVDRLGDLYSGTSNEAAIPDKSSKRISAAIAFVCLFLFAVVIYLYQGLLSP